MKISRRVLLGTSLIAAALPIGAVRAQTPDIPVAFIAPLSGPWARGGENLRRGAELAVEDINKDGGIKALGGAKLRLVVADAGDTPDKARNAIQRLLAENPSLVAGTGAWLSSFTLAITEVTERAGLPWFTNSFSDQITDRGFKNVFQTVVIGSKQAEQLLPALTKLSEAATGKKATTIGVLTDNTPAPTSMLKPLRDGGFEAAGLKLVVDRTFTPPLTDATALVQAVRAARPEMLFMPSTSTQDNKLLIEKLSEFGLGQGKLPVIGASGTLVVPEVLNLLGKEGVEGVMTILAAWPTKENAELVERFKARFKESWMTSDSIETYGHIQLIKTALEKSGVGRADAINAALRALDIKDGAAAYFPGHRVRFDEKGRRIDAELVVVQWQGGQPVLVYPTEFAAAKPRWGTAR